MSAQNSQITKQQSIQIDIMFIAILGTTLVVSIVLMAVQTKSQRGGVAMFIICLSSITIYVSGRLKLNINYNQQKPSDQQSKYRSYYVDDNEKDFKMQIMNQNKTKDRIITNI